MNIKNILENTTAMICGRIDATENSFEKMAGVLEYNKSVLLECDSVILVLNKEQVVSDNEINKIFDLYQQTFDICYLVQPHPVGMGRQIGHVTLDQTGYRFIKNNICTQYTMKLCNDILVHEKFLQLDVEPADLYFLPSVGINDMIRYMPQIKLESELVTKYVAEKFCYQSWFFIAPNSTPYIYESDEEVDRCFQLWNRAADPSQNSVLCAEHSLVKWSVANDLVRHSLYSPEQFDAYCQFVMRNNIHDGSLKNVIVEPLGIAHYHASGLPLQELDLSPHK